MPDEDEEGRLEDVIGQEQETDCGERRKNAQEDRLEKITGVLG